MEFAEVEGVFTELGVLADEKGLESREHFLVYGTLVPAWARDANFRRKNGSDG